jgi:hypothetical protein
MTIIKQILNNIDDIIRIFILFAFVFITLGLYIIEFIYLKINKIYQWLFN